MALTGKFSLRLLAACLCTQAVALAIVVGGSAPYIALYRYHGHELPYAWRPMFGLMFFGAIVVFLPTLAYALILTVLIHWGRRRNWPGWIPYLAAGILAVTAFLVVISPSGRPIPELAMNFHPSEPLVQRPGLSSSEVPLLAIAVAAGLAGAWICDRMLRLGSGKE